MAIVSVSLNDDNIAVLDELQRIYGLSGRSEAVRSAIRSAKTEVMDLRDMDGLVEGVLIIVRKDHADPWMSIIQARHEAEIKTQMHSHLNDHKCLEVMVVSGDGVKIKEMLSEINSQDKADYVKFVRNRRSRMCIHTSECPSPMPCFRSWHAGCIHMHVKTDLEFVKLYP